MDKAKFPRSYCDMFSNFHTDNDRLKISMRTLETGEGRGLAAQVQCWEEGEDGGIVVCILDLVVL
jgi:hypothetical protein